MPIISNPLTIVQTGGSGEVDLNIAYGSTPPSDTSKLWVKQATPAAKVIAKQNIAGFVLGTSTETMSATLANAVSGTSCAAVGTDIYIFGGYSGSNGSEKNTIQKYDTITNTRTTVSATLATKVYDTSCAAVGTDIYIFGGRYYNSGNKYLNTIQKYDTLTNTCTTMSATLSYQMYNTSCTAVGTDIYIFGGMTGLDTYSNTIQKYDTLTNTCTTMSATLSAAMSNASCAAVGTDIYILGGYGTGGYYNTIQKYDTITNTRTTMSATLADGRSNASCAAVGTNIYILGGLGSSENRNIIQKYDTITNTCTKMSATLSGAVYDTSCAAVGTDIYIFGGVGSSRYNSIQRLMIELSLTQNNLLLTSIYNGKEFKLVNSDTAEISFNVNNAYIGNSENKAEFVDAYLYEDGAWVNVNTGEEYTAE